MINHVGPTVRPGSGRQKTTPLEAPPPLYTTAVRYHLRYGSWHHGHAAAPARRAMGCHLPAAAEYATCTSRSRRASACQLSRAAPPPARGGLEPRRGRARGGASSLVGSITWSPIFPGRRTRLSLVSNEHCMPSCQARTGKKLYAVPISKFTPPVGREVSAFVRASDA